MVARQFFDDGITAIVLEHDKISDKVKKAAFIKHATQQTSSCGMVAGATVSPSIVRHGMKRSLSALIVPMRASSPSEIISTALWTNSAGICCL